jgi:1-phosphofructokinase
MAKILTITLNPAIDQTVEIPDFASGKVNRVAHSRLDAGGKGINVASILSDLKVPSIATGFLGKENTSIFEQHFAAKRIEDRFLRVPGLTRIGIKVVDPKSRETTDINFPGLPLGPRNAEDLLEQVDQLVESGMWCVLSGSLPPGLPADCFEQLIGHMHARGGRVVLDTSGEPLKYALQAGPEIVKPNIYELEEVLGTSLRDRLQILHSISLLRRHTKTLVAISMGGEGAVFSDGNAVLLARPPRVEVRSTVGAGDAMVAGIVWSQIQGLDLLSTARIATAFGSYAVSRCGSELQLNEIHRLQELVTIEVLEGEPSITPVAAGEGV